MKIVMVHPHDVFALDEPWTIRIRQLALEYRRAGHEVRLAFFPSGSAGVPSLDGVGVFPLDRQHGGTHFAANLGRLRELLRWADLVHLQKAFYHAVGPTLMAAWLEHKPMHYDWDDWEEKIWYDGQTQSNFIGRCFARIERWLPRCVQSLSVSSQRLREEAIRRGFPSERIVHAPVGADLDRFHPARSDDEVRTRLGLRGPVVLYVGQLLGASYAHLFVRAAGLLSRQGVKATFLVVGGGYRLKELHHLASCVGAGQQLSFTGWVPHEAVPDFVAAADVAVACFEDNEITRCKSPLKIAEYLAAGKAIVASDVGGEVRQMVDGVGRLVTPGDPSALAEEIARLLRDSSLRARLGHKARRRAETYYSWSATAGRLLEAYHRITA